MKTLILLSIALTSLSAQALGKRVYQCKNAEDAPTVILQLGEKFAWLGSMRLENYRAFDEKAPVRGYDRHTNQDWWVLTAPTGLITGQETQGVVRFYHEDLKYGLSRTVSYVCQP